MSTQTNAYRLGKAAEYRVASELIIRGIFPCFPSMDEGTDLVTSDGVRLQIKTSNVTFESGAASFTLCARKKHGQTGWRKFSTECDFLVLWHMPTSRFWIAPSALFDGFTRCVVGTRTRKARWTPEVREKVVQLRSDGLSQNDIAVQLGMSRFNVRHKLNSPNYGKRLSGRGKDGATVTLSEQVEAYENSWDLLRLESFDDSVASMEEASQCLTESR